MNNFTSYLRYLNRHPKEEYQQKLWDQHGSEPPPVHCERCYALAISVGVCILVATLVIMITWGLGGKW